jgi:hypothetical protein
MEKERTIFDYMNSIFYKKRLENFNAKECPPFLLLMWLSHDNDLIKMVNKMNDVLWMTPQDKVYEYFYQKVPRGKRFIKWAKKEKESKEKEKLRKDLIEDLRISKREANVLMSYRRLFK